MTFLVVDFLGCTATAAPLLQPVLAPSAAVRTHQPERASSNTLPCMMLLSLLPFIAARVPCRDSRGPVYHPSELENEWVGTHRIVEGRVCTIAARQLNASKQQGELSAGACRIKAWLNYTHSSLGKKARAPTNEERAVLSRRP